MFRTYIRTAQLSSRAHESLDILLGQLTGLWNQGLSWRKTAWEQEDRSVFYREQEAALTKLRQQFPEWSQFHNRAHRSALLRLDRAYQKFFKNGGFPRFKSPDRGIRSFDIEKPPKVKSTGKSYAISIKGVGRLKFKKPLPEGDVKVLRVVRTPRRVKLQFVMEVPDPNVIDIRPAVGIDLGIKSRVICSDGTKLPKNKLDRDELKRRQRKLSRAKRGSNNRKKKRKAFARQWQRVTDREKGILHQQTASLVRNRSARFYVEDLKIPNMVKNHHLARSIHEQQWGNFVSMLTYKAESAGGWVRKVPAKNTTQICSSCGSLPETPITLKDRMYHCYACGVSIDRDTNAAVNVLHKGEFLHPAETFAGTLAGGRSDAPLGASTA